MSCSMSRILIQHWLFFDLEKVLTFSRTLRCVAFLTSFGLTSSTAFLLSPSDNLRMAPFMAWSVDSTLSVAILYSLHNCLTVSMKKVRQTAGQWSYCTRARTIMWCFPAHYQNHRYILASSDQAACCSWVLLCISPPPPKWNPVVVRNVFIKNAQ